jgi:hypothetical protein
VSCFYELFAITANNSVNSLSNHCAASTFPHDLSF